MKVVVIGGSGLIGRKLMPLLLARGHEAMSASPSSGVNAVTGVGLADAVAGADVVVDVSNPQSFAEAEAVAFFEASTRNLLAAEARAGVRRHVALSVVGVDQMGAEGYMRAKVVQERLIREGGLPFTIVRATQFFEFIRTIAEGSTIDGEVRLPAAKFQPIAADDVAACLADVVESRPTDAVVEVAGPDNAPMADFVRAMYSDSSEAPKISSGEDYRYFGYRLDDGTLTPAGAARIAPTRFSDWLVRS